MHESSTCCNSVRPASRCSTLARSDFIRVPLPAAMITMFSPMMSMPRYAALRIIGALLLGLSVLLSGCSVLRTVGYSQAPNLVYWRLDSYLDFNEEQAPRVREAIADWFAWHRATQLPDYVDLVSRARAQLPEPATPAIACQWWHEVEQRVDAAVLQAAPEFAEIVPSLAPEQLVHLERRFAKSIDEMRRDMLQPSADERRREAVKRTVERFEMFYGRLDAEQRKRVAAGVAESPFDAERFIAERRARHQDTLALLRRLTAERATPEAARTALRELAEQTQRSPRPDYRDYQRKLIDYNCAFAAQIHNITTPAQRQAASRRLGDWENDLRSWMNGA